MTIFKNTLFCGCQNICLNLFVVPFGFLRYAAVFQHFRGKYCVDPEGDWFWFTWMLQRLRRKDHDGCMSQLEMWPIRKWEGEMDIAQAEKIMSDKRKVTISDLHTALQFESSQMQKANFYSDGIFKLISRVSVIREYCEKQ